jgi:transposase InsO family protein
MRWLTTQAVKPVHIEPGSPWDNGFVESLQNRLGDERLDRAVLRNGKEARSLIEAWRGYYNDERFHSGLGYRTPAEISTTFTKPIEPVISLHSGRPFWRKLMSPAPNS